MNTTYRIQQTSTDRRGRLMDPAAELVEARRAVEHADRELVQAIMDARGAGMSLRAIADAAGVSHEKVRQILRR